MTVTQTAAPAEDLDSFRTRLRAWLPEHLTRIDATGDDDIVGLRMESDGLDPADAVARGRTVSAILYEGGFAGLTYPRDCGGQGLPVSYLHAFYDEARPYDLSPMTIFGMTLGMIGPTILNFGTPEQKARWIPRMLRGEDIWIQFLSEPSGGSDLAGALTRAQRDGDEFVVNGSKIWTSYGDFGDMGLLVCRTNVDVPKHRGLSVLLVPVRSPGLTVVPVRLANGESGFCQEFFDDVRVPAQNLLGELNDGWTVTSRLLVHERNSLGGSSEYHQMTGRRPTPGGNRPAAGSGGDDELVALAKATGQASDPHVRQLVAEAYVLSTVGSQLSPRIAVGTRKGVLPPNAGSIPKLFRSTAMTRRADIGMELAGAPAVAWQPGDGLARDRGLSYLMRQMGSILSGTSEIQRNIISERVLGLPREAAPDRELPFSQVRKNTMPTRG